MPVRVSTPPSLLSNIVPVGSGETGTPLFLVHGMSGEVLLYRHLIRHIGPGRRLFAIQSNGLDEFTRPFTSVEDMATHYLKQVLKLVPDGPCAFAGVCGGVPVAYEMACQLTAMGRSVPCIVLLDNLPRPPEPIAVRVAIKVHAVVKRGLPRIVRHSARRVSRLTERFIKAAVFRPSQRLIRHSASHRRQQEISNMQRATSRYRAPNYSGRVLLITGYDRAGRLSPFGRTQWAARVGASLETQVISGAAHRTLLEEPFVQETARVILRALS
jgi:thioesterase domain-containing protein